MMKKLRLLVTKECNRRCKGCCNKDWNLDALPIEIDYSQYEEVLITGGEPLLFMHELQEIVHCIKTQNSNVKIYVYTAYCYMPSLLTYLLYKIDGITLTLHKKSDAKYFKTLDKWLDGTVTSKTKSLRLNVFKGIKAKPSDIWKVKDNLVWTKNCPLPKDEVFARIPELWRS